MPEQRPAGALRLAGLCALALCVTAGCARTPATITRVRDGREVRGAFVSPYSYEHYLTAEVAAARGDAEGAAREVESARLGVSDDPYLAARQAELLEAAGHRRRADRALAEGLALDPESEAVWLARARILEGRGDDAGAAEAFERAAEVAPDSADAALALAHHWSRVGQPTRATAILSDYAARHPDGQGRALEIRLRLLLRDGGDEAFEQARALAEAMGDRRLDADLRRLLVERALSAARPVAAADLARRWLTERDAPLRLRALLAAGHGEEARALFRRLPPDAFGSLVEWARYARRLTTEAEASSAAEEAAEASPSPETRRWLARVRLEAGQVDAALELLGGLEAPTLLRDALRRGGLGTVAAELPSEGDGRGAR